MAEYSGHQIRVLVHQKVRATIVRNFFEFVEEREPSLWGEQNPDSVPAPAVLDIKTCSYFRIPIHTATTVGGCG